MPEECGEGACAFVDGKGKRALGTFRKPANISRDLSFEALLAVHGGL